MYILFQFIKKHQLKILLSLAIIFLIMGEISLSTIIFIIYLSLIDTQ